MTNSTADFLIRLGQHEHLPTIVSKARGTIQLDVEGDAGTDSWFVTLRRGTAQVSQQDQAPTSRQQPDLVIRGHRALFDRLVQGQAQLYASLLRNEINVEGNLALLSCFERLLPGPEGAHHPRVFTQEGESGS
ncbi:SCP2 sterol-binding domain-containing protein [Micromonospora sp. MS34]|uniref:SCP2 sterol-binding domain-containing protein n=1 Tax=Micromonospora sp. MS34 TaxID=3385971 RepID=UPI0039A34EA1